MRCRAAGEDHAQSSHQAYLNLRLSGIRRTPYFCQKSPIEAILSSLGSASFMDLSRPPVKAGGGADQCWLLLQLGTTSELYLLQLVNAREMLVDEHRIGKGPEMFGRLEFRRIRR